MWLAMRAFMDRFVDAAFLHRIAGLVLPALISRTGPMRPPAARALFQKRLLRRLPSFFQLQACCLRTCCLETCGLKACWLKECLLHLLACLHWIVSLSTR